MSTEPTQHQDQDTPEGERQCLHCLLNDAFDKWVESEGGVIDAVAAGYCVGQFFAETMGDITENGTHEQIHDFIAHFHAAQHETARRRAEEDEKAAAKAEPVTPPNPETRH